MRPGDSPSMAPVIACAAATNFSDTMRRASAGAFDPPSASLMHRRTITCCDSAASIARSHHGLNIDILPRMACRPSKNASALRWGRAVLFKRALPPPLRGFGRLRVHVDRTLGELGQRHVGLLLFVQRRVE